MAASKMSRCQSSNRPRKIPRPTKSASKSAHCAAACFDKAVEDYNQYMIHRRNCINEYMWVDGTTLYAEGEELKPKIVRSFTNEIFRIDMVFIGSPVDGYRMHCEIWKVDTFGVTSNIALKKY